MEDQHPLLDRTIKTNVCLFTKWEWMSFMNNLRIKCSNQAQAESLSASEVLVLESSKQPLPNILRKKKTGRGEKDRNWLILYPLPQTQEMKKMSIVGNNTSLAVKTGKRDLTLFCP